MSKKLNDMLADLEKGLEKHRIPEESKGFKWTDELNRLRYLRKRAMSNMCTQRCKVRDGAKIKTTPDHWKKLVDTYTDQIKAIQMNGYNWRYVDGTVDYMVSDCGKVFSLYQNRFLSQTPDKEGYLQVAIFINSIEHKRKVHRIVATAFIPNPLNKPQVNHLDFNKTNNRYSNLVWATSQEDADHKVAASRQAKGDMFPSRKGRKINRKKQLQCQ